MKIPFFGILQSILDRIPTRMESLKNREDTLKREIKELQLKKPFLATDSIRYSTVLHELSIVEKRIANAGGR